MTALLNAWRIHRASRRLARLIERNRASGAAYAKRRAAALSYTRKAKA